MSRGNSEAKQKGFESTSIRDNFDTEVEDGTLNTKVVNFQRWTDRKKLR